MWEELMKIFEMFKVVMMLMDINNYDIVSWYLDFGVIKYVIGDLLKMYELKIVEDFNVWLVGGILYLVLGKRNEFFKFDG